MFIVYYTIHILFRKSQRALLIALTITAISMWVLKKIFEGNEVFVVLNNSISLWLAMMYFPFFVFGVIAAMHKEKFHKLLDSKYFIALTAAIAPSAAAVITCLRGVTRTSPIA